MATIKSIPSAWDDSIVLQVSQVGECAAFARRSGDRWFVAILNGPEARTVRVPATFLGAGRYQAMLVRDERDEPAAVKLEEATVTRNDWLNIALRPSGGFVASFSKTPAQ